MYACVHTYLWWAIQLHRAVAGSVDKAGWEMAWGPSSIQDEG